jgi:hypothetical protein
LTGGYFCLALKRIITMEKLPMKKLNLALSIAAGLLGGTLSHYVWTQPVQAQSSASSPKEVRSQSFVLVDEQGIVQGVFTFDERMGAPTTIKLLDGKGREIWEAGGVRIRPAGALPNSGIGTPILQNKKF